MKDPTEPALVDEDTCIREHNFPLAQDKCYMKKLLPRFCHTPPVQIKGRAQWPFSLDTQEALMSRTKPVLADAVPNQTQKTMHESSSFIRLCITTIQFLLW
jgi:hypothetical protein